MNRFFLRVQLDKFHWDKTVKFWTKVEQYSSLLVRSQVNGRSVRSLSLCLNKVLKQDWFQIPSTSLGLVWYKNVHSPCFLNFDCPQLFYQLITLAILLRASWSELPRLYLKSSSFNKQTVPKITTVTPTNLCHPPSKVCWLWGGCVIVNSWLVAFSGFVWLDGWLLVSVLGSCFVLFLCCLLSCL